MSNFNDLSEIQQEALTNAFGHPDEYKDLSLSTVDDPVEASKYEVFRDSLEGKTVSEGAMDQDEIDSYKNIGFLRESEGGLEINSVWGGWQIEALADNDMYDFDNVIVYASESSSNPEVAVVSDDEDALIEIEDALTYRINGVDSSSSASEASVQKIEEISKDFIDFFTQIEKEDEDYEASTSKSETQNKGGDNTMTDDYDFELNGVETRHAGALEHYENQDQYGDLESDELEALGLAVYLEDAVSGESDLVDRDDMVDYIMENDVDGEAFVEFKRGLASDYDEFADTMEAFIGHRTDLIEELGATGTLYQALQEETAAERDSAEEAMGTVASAASDARTSSEWLDNVADLDGAIQTEQDSTQRKEDLEGTLQDIRDDLGVSEDEDEA